uniref:Uncharacterized protein n=1 Tax=Knipowitschia caucasica TaxID=637954 RepID=A0AAV2M4T0_KNICA
MNPAREERRSLGSSLDGSVSPEGKDSERLPAKPFPFSVTNLHQPGLRGVVRCWGSEYSGVWLRCLPALSALSLGSSPGSPRPLCMELLAGWLVVVLRRLVSLRLLVKWN